MPVLVDAIEKGGSGRKFWRVRVGSESLIMVRYSKERAENAYFVEVAQFLRGLGVRVPRVDFHDGKEGLILMEDVGAEDLWSYRDAPWEVRGRLYKRALEEVRVLHTRGHLAGELPQLQPEFDLRVYLWEQAYFLDQCLKEHFGLEIRELEGIWNRDRLAEIAWRLVRDARCLVHRDFQSQNVMVRDGDVTLIDFQGMRMGLAQYDVASLLWDPYVTLSEAEREELLAHYLQGLPGVDVAGWMEVYKLCTMQRLMQALGAYGKLGHVDKKVHFLEYIPVALRRLREVMLRVSGMERLAELAEELAERR